MKFFKYEAFFFWIPNIYSGIYDGKKFWTVSFLSYGVHVTR